MTGIKLKFRIYGDNFSPFNVTSLLNVQSTNLALKGDEIIYTINGVVVKTGKLHIETKW